MSSALPPSARAPVPASAPVPVSQPTNPIDFKPPCEASLQILAEFEDDQSRLQREEEDRASAAMIEALLLADQEEERKRLEAAQNEEEAFKQFLSKESKDRQAELDKKRYVCNICGDEFPIEKMYTLEECFHRFCFECLEGHFTTQICDGNVKEIRCPRPGCPHIITYQEVRHIVKGQNFEKFDRFLLKAALDDDPNCRWCPRGCGSAMIGNPLNPMMRCPNAKCGFTFCFRCRDEWHGDATCEQYQEWKKENSEADARFAKWAEEHTKQCPKCKSNIEKNGGTCKKCKHEFCWLCFTPYKAGHFNEPGDCNGKQFT